MSGADADDGYALAVTRLRWLRGTYLDQMVLLEGVIDAHLHGYLGVREDARMLF